MTANGSAQSRRTAASLILLPALFLVCYAASVGPERIPGRFVAEESTYALMTRSLWDDGDLLWTYLDSRRAARDHAGTLGRVVLMTPDQGDRVYFAKPFLYAFLAVPFYALLGTNGFLVFNALMFVLLVGLGARYLGGRNPPVRSALLAGGFFLLSAAGPYVFWIQPEVFNMLTLFLGGYFWLSPGPLMDRARAGELDAHPSPVGLRDPMVRVALSGFFFALSAFSKLPHAAFGVVLILHCLVSRRFGRALSGLLAFVITLAVLHMAQLAMTETASVYHSTRKSFESLDQFPHNVPSRVAWRRADEGGVSRYGGGGLGLARLDGRAAYNVKYLFFGRHTGLFPYFLPGLAVLLLHLFRRRDRFMAGRGFLLAAMTAVLVFYIIWFPDNYQGGADFIGNRHAVSIYPAFLLLVGSLAGASAHLLAWSAGGLFIAQAIFAPFGAEKPRGDLQAHVQAPFCRLMPYETTLRYLPGYQDLSFGMKSTPRRYLVRLLSPGLKAEGSRFRLHGMSTEQLLVTSRHPLARLVLLTDDPAVQAWCRGAESRAVSAPLLQFPCDAAAKPVPGSEQRLLLDGPRPVASHLDWRDGGRRFFYLVKLHRTEGAALRAAAPSVRLAFLGEGEPWLRRDFFRARLEHAEVPQVMPAGEELRVPLLVQSRSPFAWDGTVRLSYHWRRAGYDASRPGRTVVWDGLQTRLPAGGVAPGAMASMDMRLRAPDSPGDYVLEVDLVAAQVSWFAARSPAGEPLGRFPVRVIDPSATGVDQSPETAATIMYDKGSEP